MNFKIILLVILISSLSLAIAKEEKISAEVEKELGGDKEVAVIVKFKEHKPLGVASAKISFNNAKKELMDKGFKEKLELESFNAVAGSITDEVLGELKKDPNVEEIQLDH